MSRIASPIEGPPAPSVLTSPTSSGVITIPISPDSVALNTATATLPRASAVIATDEEIVDGSAHR